MKNLPNNIPLFPLTGAILMPKGHLPLSIFEPRYLEMIKIANIGNKMIGMIQPQRTDFSAKYKNKDVSGGPNQDPYLYKFGCAGLITGIEKNDDGRYSIVLTGVKRFEIVEELLAERTFRKARVSYLNYYNDGDQRFDEKSRLRKKFMEKISQYFNHIKVNVDMQYFDNLGDEELINSLAMVCPFDSAEKQLIIEVIPLEERTQIMIKIMDFNLNKYAMVSENKVH